MSRKLIVSDGRRQRELLIVSKIVVGRDPTCDLSEADPLLSRRHAEFSIAGEDTVVRDLGSRNGIYINGARMAEGTLQSGDVVRIGRLQMRYIEDASPLVAMPELVDDATGLVIPGPRPTAPKPPPSPAVQRPAALSGAAPRPPGASGTSPKPSAPFGSKPLPAPAPPDAADGEATSYVSPSAVRKPLTGVARPPLPSSTPRPAAPSASSPPQGPPPGDEIERTRVVPPPSRSGLRPLAPAAKSGAQPAATPGTSVVPPPALPGDDEMTSYATPRPRTTMQPPPAQSGVRPAAPPMVTAVVPPPVPTKEEELTSFAAPRPRTSVQPPPASIVKAAQPPPAPPIVQTAVQPPPLPPAEDMEEPTSVVLMPRPKTRVGPATDAAAEARAREARAIAGALEAIAAFLGTAPAGQSAAEVVRALEGALAAAPSADLVAALKELAARVSAAAGELT